MCSATLGASPVKRLTCAASAIFSYGSRGVPGVVNTRNRVPELPNAHDGSSMPWASRVDRISGERVLTVCAFVSDSRGVGVVAGAVAACGVGMVPEVERLGQRGGGLVGPAVEADEDRGHLGFPASGDGGCREVSLRRGVVVRLVVAEEHAVLAEVQRVVAPTRRGDL